MVWTGSIAILLSVWCGVVAFFDVTQRRIPNALSLSACLLALPPLLMGSASWLGANWASVGAAVGLAVLAGLPAYATGKLGAGDVKLMLAMALLSGAQPFLLSYAVAGLLALMLVGLRQFRSTHSLGPAFAPAEQWVDRLFLGPGEGWQQFRLPFGALLCAGFVLALWTDI
jgi:Flp pilus assembly protein protease CpaA